MGESLRKINLSSNYICNTTFRIVAKTEDLSQRSRSLILLLVKCYSWSPRLELKVNSYPVFIDVYR